MLEQGTEGSMQVFEVDQFPDLGVLRVRLTPMNIDRLRIYCIYRRYSYGIPRGMFTLANFELIERPS